MKTERDPVFSIIVPTLNRPTGLQRAVDSVRRQSYQDFELIVVDDASRIDYASAICGSSGLPVRLIRNPHSLGAGGARNQGLAASRGMYVSFLDDDDEYGPDFLSSSLAALQGTPATTVMSWCSVRWVDDSADDGSGWLTRIFKTEHSTSAELYEDMMSIGTGFGVTIKASYQDRRDWFDTCLKTVEDADLFLRMISTGHRPVVVPGVHVTVHSHSDVRLTDVRMHELRIRECTLLLERYKGALGTIRTLRTQLLRQIDHLKSEISAHVVSS